MRPPLVEHQVMDVVPVRTEGRTLMKDPDAENAQRVEQRDQEDGEPDSRRCHNRDIDTRLFGYGYEFDDEHGIDEADEH